MKYIVSTSGNCSKWMVFYRGNANNVYQYLNPKQYIYNQLNKDYNPNKTNFWIE